jgi:ADP-ribose pyrophosphatase YjhB (NUDIX family)
MRLQAMAQNGLEFATNDYDLNRYQELRLIAGEMLARISAEAPPIVHGILAQESGYATPKVDVRGVVFQEEKLLLVRERADGKWTLPGGWADPGASPAQNVVREIQEESGYLAKPEKILAVYDRALHPHDPPFPFHVYKIFIRCALTGGASQTDHETDGAAFFAESEIPELSIGRTTPGQIARMFEHLRNPGLPADFDLDAA